MADKWKIYTDSRNKWCWYQTAQNGQMIGASKHSFETQAECEEDAKKNGMQDDSARG